ncbi:hypothetical protein hairong_086 [Pseudomonas phage hairong]|nr:hypothetical protein hairong_086 [Pseudomonas phage hairong]
MANSKYTRDMWALAVKRGDTDESYKAWVELMRQAANKTPIRPKLFRRDLATVLAALRYWQQALLDVDSINGGFIEIATDGGTFDSMRPSEIEELCRELNTCEPEEAIAYLYKHADGTNATVSIRPPSASCKLKVIPMVAQ